MWTEEKSCCSHCGKDVQFRYNPENKNIQFFFESSDGVSSSWLTLRESARTISCNHCGMTDGIPKKIFLFAGIKF